MSFVGAENRWIWTLLHMKILGKGGQTTPPPVRSAENAVNSQSDSTGYKKSGCLREAVAQEENCNHKSKSHVSTYFLHMEYQFKERECAKPLYKVAKRFSVHFHFKNMHRRQFFQPNNLFLWNPDSGFSIT